MDITVSDYFCMEGISSWFMLVLMYLNLFSSLISSDGKILVDSFQFLNDGNGFHYLAFVFEPFDDEEIIIDLEPATHYVYNPLSTLSFAKQKADKIDTYIITQTLIMQKSVYALLKETPTAESIASMHLAGSSFCSPCKDFTQSFQK